MESLSRSVCWNPGRPLGCSWEYRTAPRFRFGCPGWGIMEHCQHLAAFVFNWYGVSRYFFCPLGPFYFVVPFWLCCAGKCTRFWSHRTETIKHERIGGVQRNVRRLLPEFFHDYRCCRSSPGNCFVFRNERLKSGLRIGRCWPGLGQYNPMHETVSRTALFPDINRVKSNWEPWSGIANLCLQWSVYGRFTNPPFCYRRNIW